MEMFVVVVAAAGFYMFNLPHVHPCQMAVPIRWEIISVLHLHQVDVGPWSLQASFGCGGKHGALSWVMWNGADPAWAQHSQLPLAAAGGGGERVGYAQRS